jgi:hypothetical protein
LGFLKNIGTENELRKLVSQCSPNGFAGGWHCPTLSETVGMYPTAKLFRDEAEREGWKSRDIAMAVVGGIIVDEHKKAEQEGDQQRALEVKAFNTKYIETLIEKRFWYDEAKFIKIAEKMTERMRR